MRSSVSWSEKWQAGLCVSLATSIAIHASVIAAELQQIQKELEKVTKTR